VEQAALETKIHFFLSFLPSCFNQKEEMKENVYYFDNTMCLVI